MTHKISLTAFLMFMFFFARSQSVQSLDMKPYFSAVIVKNVDTSSLWYQSVLMLKVKNRINDTARGFRVEILESSQLLIELIENKLWLDPKSILKDKPEGTQMQGFFKIGFKVSDVDACVTYLKNLKINVERIYKEPSGKRNFLINDPDGNLLQFFE
jgi:hypothetical protein